MILWKLLKKLLGHHPYRVIFVLLLSTSVIMSSVILLSVSAYIIAFCAISMELAMMMVPIVMVRLFGILRGVLRYFERLASHDTTFRILGNFRSDLYDDISESPMEQVLMLDKEDAFTRLVDDVERLQEFYLRTFNPYFTAILTGFIGFWMLNRWGMSPSIIFLVGYVGAIVVLPVFVYSQTAGIHREWIERVAELKVFSLEYLSGLGDLIGASAVSKYLRQFQVRWEIIYQIENKMALYKSMSTSILNVIAQLTMVVAIGGALLLVKTGHLSAILLPVITYAVIALFEGAQPVPVILQKLEHSKKATERIHQLESAVSSQSEVSIEKRDSSLEKISFQQVNYSYAGQTERTLKDISFQMEKGKRIALVGASGSGKSTISQMLLGWLRPASGRLTYSYENGQQDIWTLESASLDRTLHISVVNQQLYLFNTTIHNNLTLGNVTASDEQIQDMLQKINLDQEMNAYPEGMESLVGEGETKLSGGQKQRLGIGRALLKPADFYVFDEITAGLDAENEQQMLNMIFQETAGKGLLVITHRLIQMDQFDEIWVMDQGAIVERGSHEKLSKAESFYNRLLTIQNDVV